jgi:hypothetical protein
MISKSAVRDKFALVTKNCCLSWGLDLLTMNYKSYALPIELSVRTRLSCIVEWKLQIYITQLSQNLRNNHLEPQNVWQLFCWTLEQLLHQIYTIVKDKLFISTNCKHSNWPGCTGANPGYSMVNVGTAYHSLMIFGIQHWYMVPYRGIRFQVCCLSTSCLQT